MPSKGGGDGKSTGKKGAGGLLLDSVFTMHVQSMDLKVDETQELTVFAFPTEVRVTHCVLQERILAALPTEVRITPTEVCITQH